jgi:hypothetical protein
MFSLRCCYFNNIEPEEEKNKNWFTFGYSSWNTKARCRNDPIAWVRLSLDRSLSLSTQTSKNQALKGNETLISSKSVRTANSETLEH